MSDPESPPPSFSNILSPTTQDLFGLRSRKQFTLFLTGAGFLTLSTLLTRRALLRRHLSVVPKFYRPSNQPPSIQINGRFEAIEALALASINVTSFMMMMGSGLLWAFDISTIDDLRRKIPNRRYTDWNGGENRAEEEELEKWMGGLLRRQDDDGKRESQVSDSRTNARE